MLVVWFAYVAFLLVIPPDPQIPIALFLSPVFAFVIGVGTWLLALAYYGSAYSQRNCLVMRILGIMLVGGAVLSFIGELMQWAGYW